MQTKYIALCFLLFIIACKKDFLEERPNKSQVIPTTIEDLQAMLDNDNKMSNFYCNAGEIASDNFWATGTTLNTQAVTVRNAYLWKDDVFNDNSQNDWTYPYISTLYANIALEGINKLTPSSYQLADWNNVKGSALFFRAFAFSTLAQEFAKPYDAATAANDLGIVLRLTSDLNEKSVRSTVQQTCDRIITDALEAANLLPVVPLYKSRPSKPAAFALLARTYLSMSIYDKAGMFADSALKYYNTLIDYNTLNTAATNPLPLYNNEVFFHCRSATSSPFYSASVSRIDSVLYQSYDNNDLRKKAFFKPVTGNTVSFCGSYTGNAFAFVGFATDEMYLIRAEAKARAGDKDGALSDLNTLLQKRWKSGTFTPVTAADANTALVKILQERRKELLLRSLRWSDLRRLNKEPQFAVTLTKVVDGQTYTLPPNDKRYTFPIPELVIQMTGMPQNER